MAQEDELIIRSAEARDFLPLQQLCERRFGSGYLEKEDFEDRIRYPELFLVADSGGQPVAAVSMTPEAPYSLARAMQMTEEEVLSAARGKPTIHFRSAITAEGFEGRGLIQLLLSRVIENARRLGYGLILSPNWKYDGKIPAGKIHDRLGFVNIGERKNLWLNQKGYSCVYCKGPCRCTAVLYQLQL